MNPTTLEMIATILFVVAVLHTFMVKKIEHIGHHFPHGSMMGNLFHYLAEVEAVFGMWALVFICAVMCLNGVHGAVEYLEGLNFTEPAFVFVIMCMAGTRPLIKLAEKLIVIAAKILPFPPRMAFYISALIMGPLLGSFITEPAAMTVTALILLENFYKKGMSEKFMYATIGLLFVNVSIGGTLTHFAAPPVLMVAGKWGWGMSHMLGHYGYKAAISNVISTVLIAMMFKSELQGEFKLAGGNDGKPQPLWWITFIHILFLGIVVLAAHHMVVFLAAFIFFLGFATITKSYQDTLKVKESLMVGFFLAGLVTLGALQKWWLQPVLVSMGSMVLYVGATALTAITDNAALTYLGSLVEGLSEESKYYLVAGAVVGGGLTVIANAPNPAGYGILKDSFGEKGVSPLGLFKAALIPTVIAFILIKVLPSF